MKTKTQADVEQGAYRCGLCGSPVFRRLYGSLGRDIGHHFVKCTSCGLIQDDSQADGEEETAFYEQTYYTMKHKRTEPASRSHLFYRLVEILGEAHGGRLLDLGCGPGEFVAIAKEWGWYAVGLERSPQAVEEGRGRFGVELHCGTICDWKGKEDRFDVVTSWNVIDQISNPLETLKIVRSLQDESGRVFVRVPNGIFHHMVRTLVSWIPSTSFRKRMASVYSVHAFSFTPATLTRLFQAAGYDDVKVCNSPLTRGDPAARLSGLRLHLFNAAKRTGFIAAECVRVVSLGRVLMAPSLLVTATSRAA